MRFNNHGLLDLNRSWLLLFWYRKSDPQSAFFRCTSPFWRPCRTPIINYDESIFDFAATRRIFNNSYLGASQFAFRFDQRRRDLQTFQNRKANNGESISRRGSGHDQAVICGGTADFNWIREQKATKRCLGATRLFN